MNLASFFDISQPCHNDVPGYDMTDVNAPGHELADVTATPKIFLYQLLQLNSRLLTKTTAHHTQNPATRSITQYAAIPPMAYVGARQAIRPMAG